jgi:hypothetical protein
MKKYNEGILFQNHHLQLFPFGGKFKTSEKIECSWQIVYYNCIVKEYKLFITICLFQITRIRKAKDLKKLSLNRIKKTFKHETMFFVLSYIIKNFKWII